MKVYTARDVSKLLDLSVGQVRSYARAGFLEPDRGPRGEYRFSFQDLILLRTAKGLIAQRIAPRKVRRALRRLKHQLPTGQPLTGVQIRADGDQVVVHEGGTVWEAESGQAQLNFEVAELARQVAPHARRAAEEAFESGRSLGADDWHALASDLEAAAPDQARDAYRRALEVDPHHADSRINLGRLLHGDRRFNAAEAHYRLALSIRPDDSTAQFNLAVCLEDMGRTQDAVQAYRRAIELDPECADAFYNVARLYEKLGDAAAALRHLKAYRRLTE